MLPNCPSTALLTLEAHLDRSVRHGQSYLTAALWSSCASTSTTWRTKVRCRESKRYARLSAAQRWCLYEPSFTLEERQGPAAGAFEQCEGSWAMAPTWKTLCYQYLGMMNPPHSPVFAGHPSSAKLYTEYKAWVDEKRRL